MKTRNVKNRVLLPVVVVTVASAFLLSGQERSSVILQPAPGGPPAVTPSTLSFTKITRDDTGFQFGVAWPSHLVITNNALDLYGSTNLISRDSIHWQHLGTRKDVPVSQGWDAFALPYADLPSSGTGWEKSGFFVVATQLDEDDVPVPSPFEEDPFEADFGDDDIVTDDTQAAWFNFYGGAKKLTDILFDPWGGSVLETLPFPLTIAGTPLTGLCVSPNGLLSFSSQWGDGWGWKPPADLDTTDLTSDTMRLVVAGFWGNLMRGEDSDISLAYVTAGGYRHCVVEYSNMLVVDSPVGAIGTVSFQIVFRENVSDRVVVLFRDVEGNGDGRAATLGVQRYDADSQQYKYNDPSAVADGRMVVYIIR